MADFTFTGDVGPIQTAAPFGNFRNVNNRYLNLAKQFNGVTLQFHTGFGVSLGSIAWGSTASNFSSIVNVYADANYGNYTFTAPAIGTRERGWINGRRPAKGLQYPRGYYNK
tara:strand:+ start:5309 stop:5644 length:336 start_codon:yes stop_codon:yes gene_type:complete